MGSIELYAELLLHIEHVTVFITLPTGGTEDTRIWLDHDGKQLSLRHGGQLASIALPATLASGATMAIPAGNTGVSSFRLPIDVDESLALRRRQSSWREQPWSAAGLTEMTGVACRACKHDLVASTISSWKDLPSQNWAEMMDFWHCHKPNTLETLKHTASNVKKGYSASNNISTTPGVALVDLLHFLLSEEDSPGIQGKRSDASVLECVSCHKSLGIRDEMSGAFRIYKWNIILRNTNDAAWGSYPARVFISTQLLSLIDSQAIYKFIAYSGNMDRAEDAMLLWVLSPDVTYSTSSAEGVPKRAMKVLYQPVSNPLALLEKESLKIEELQLPAEVLETLRTDLQASTSILPTSARKLGNWDVALLERYNGG